MLQRSIFTRTTEENLPESAAFGVPFFTSDTGKMFIGQGEGKSLAATDGEDEVVIVDTIEDLPVAGSNSLLYVVRSDSMHGNQMMLYIFEEAYIPAYAREYHFIEGDGIHIESVDDTYTITSTVDAGIVGSLHVDEAGLEDGRVLSYDGVLGNLRYIDLPKSSELSLTQVTKLLVLATPEEPKIYDLVIPYTKDFKRMPVEVLKLSSGGQDVLNTVSHFDNSDADKFIVDSDVVVFDGTMHLMTELSGSFEEVRNIGNRKEFIVDVPTFRFNKITSMEVV